MSLEEECIRVQTCVLRVSIHCDDCRKKVENRLRSIDGVYVVRADAGLGVVTVRVTMSPEMSPDALVKKIRSSRKKTYVEVVAPSQPPLSACGGSNGGGDGDQLKGVQAPLSDGVVGIENVAPRPTPRPAPSVKPSLVPPRQPVVPGEKDEEEEEEEEEEAEENAEEEEEEGDDEVPTENVVLPPPVKGGGGSRAPSRVASPMVKGVNAGGGLTTLPGSVSKGHIGGLSSFPQGGGQMGDMAAAVRAMAAARGSGAPMGGGGGQNMQGIHMGQQMGPTQPSYSLPPRPTYVDPANYIARANLNPADPYHQQLAGHAPSYREPQYPSYHYSAPPPASTHNEDGFTYKFSDENTGSCTVM